MGKRSYSGKRGLMALKRSEMGCRFRWAEGAVNFSERGVCVRDGGPHALAVGGCHNSFAEHKGKLYYNMSPVNRQSFNMGSVNR